MHRVALAVCGLEPRVRGGSGTGQRATTPIDVETTRSRIVSAFFRRQFQRSEVSCFATQVGADLGERSEKKG